MVENKKYDDAILKKDGCLYCPECGARLSRNRKRGWELGAIERQFVVYAKCRCVNVGDDWSFTYMLKGLEE